MKITAYLNFRTLAVLIVSQLSVFIAITYELRFQLNPLIIGLVLAFPLGFSIQAAFKRRDRALEYLSLYKSGAISVHNSIQISEKLSEEKKQDMRFILIGMTNELIQLLIDRHGKYAAVQEYQNRVIDFINVNSEFISNRIIIRIVRYMQHVSEGSTYLASLAKHRTMIGLRVYALFFIFVFPFIQAPMLLDKFFGMAPDWFLFLLSALASLFLITLYNFQQKIEYPFDQDGPDNIQLNMFKLEI